MILLQVILWHREPPSQTTLIGLETTHFVRRHKQGEESVQAIQLLMIILFLVGLLNTDHNLHTIPMLLLKRVDLSIHTSSEKLIHMLT